jgi:hypothetical protein
MHKSRIAAILVAGTLGALHAQTITTNPIPAPIQTRGLAVELREIARLPDTRSRLAPGSDVNPAGWARINVVRDLPDGRRFVNDSRGLLYLLAPNGTTSVYLDIAPLFPHAIYSRLASGLIGFDFHPEFATNGLFYTVHGERAPGNPATPHFIPPGYTAKDVTHHNVISEWHAADPRAAVFKGTRRELLRVAHAVQNLSHPYSTVLFNPTAKPGSPDYGALYTSGSDLGFSNGGGPNANNPGQTQRLDSLVGAILRIDPRSPSVTGGRKGLGDYTVLATAGGRPQANRFAIDNDPATLDEIYAYGFRNAHRFSWDPADGTMFAFDIGMNHIEEINIVRNGENYGWMKREGIWENGIVHPGGALNQLIPLPADLLEGRTKDGFVYPVAMYDHDEGVAISGGYAYRGRIAALRGKLIFGDVQRGRLFAADLDALKKADDGIPQTMAPIEEIQLYVMENGARRNVTFLELVNAKMGTTLTRADLHLAQTGDGELLLTSRQDGTIRAIVP